MYVVVFHVPQSHLDQVKDAMFAAGAGRIGSYERCCHQIPGLGQFTPSDGAHPYLGTVGIPEFVDEYRVEMVVENHLIRPVIEALIGAHPYEVPSYHIIEVQTLEQIAPT